MEKERCPILEFQMQNGEQLGTDPPPSLAKKKKKKVRLQKKLPKTKPFSAKKTAEPKQGYTKRVTDTHKKNIQPQDFKQKSGVLRTVTAVE